MATAKFIPSVEYLHECFSYDPSTGVLTWKTRPREHFPRQCSWGNWNARFSGKAAGHDNSFGYLHVAISMNYHRVHRIAWAMTYGEWPENQVDHINGNRKDNRIANLRHATSGENGRNRGKWKTNTSGYKGAFYHEKTGKYFSRIGSHGKYTYLGIFPTAKEAHAAYCAAADRLHGAFVNHG